MGNFSIGVSFEAFHRQAITRIRAAANQISDFTTGAVSGMYIPVHPDAFKWLGIPSNCDTDDNACVTLTHSIVPGGNMIRPAGWRDDPTREAVDCGAFVTQKLAACLRAMRRGEDFCSDSLPDDMVIEGQYNGPGALGFTLLPFDYITGQTLSDTPWIQIIYGVSGATGAEDKWCAYHAWDALVDCLCPTNSSQILHSRNYDPNIAVIRGEIDFKPEFAQSPQNRSVHFGADRPQH